VAVVALAATATVLYLRRDIRGRVEQIATFPPNISDLAAASCAPDRLLVLSTSRPGKQRDLWVGSVAAGGWSQVLPGRKILKAAISPDGGLIAVRCDDDRVVVVDAATNSEVWSPDTTSPVQAVAFAENGRLLISCSDCVSVLECQGFTVEHRVERCHGKGVSVLAVSLSREGTLLEATSSVEVVRWSLQTGSEEPGLSPSPPVEAVRAVISPNGEYVAFMLFLDGIRAWKSASPKSLEIVVPFSTPPWSEFCFSADGKYLAVAGGEGYRVLLFHAGSWQRCVRSPRNPSFINALAFTTQGVVYTGDIHGALRAWRFQEP
jgi:WD40 repeat protein